MAFRSPILNVMVKATEKAAKSLIRDFGEVEQLQVSVKGPSDFVSQADIQAEKLIKAELQKARPRFGFVMEESGEEVGLDTSHRWVVDPLDGTTNFLHGIPHFAISIALEQDGEVIAGVVYNPITNEMFLAEKGGGAFFNEHRIRVSSRRKLEDAVLTTGIPHRGRGDHPRYLQESQRVMAATAGVRRFGSAALDLAYVAAGRCDGYWEWGLKPWDIAAGLILVREAGGTVASLDGGNVLETGNVLATNSALHGSIAGLLSSKRE